jgi:enamine deaminase RidA (YjgF/YER057c/UK114 family)
MPTTGTIEEKLRGMGMQLPDAPAPFAAYTPCVRSGNMLYVSGQVPRVGGELKYRGHAGGDATFEDAVGAAKACALNALSVIKNEIGDLDRIRRIVKVTGFVCSAPGFNEQHKVVDGASVFLRELLGEKGKHARSAVGVNELPMGILVELEMIVEVD